MSTIPNTTPVPNILIDRYMPQLSDTAFRLALIIVRKTYGWLLDPITGMRKHEDWIAYSQLMEFSGRKRQAVSMALRELESLGLIDIRDIKGTPLRTIEERRGKKLMYRFTTSMKSGLVGPNQYDNQTLIIKHTKETNTKTSTKVDAQSGDKTPSCPLLNGSPLRQKYPNGHTECSDYVQSEEKARTRKFVNRPKQFSFIHKILRAGYDFDAMNRTITQVERKYGAGAWDFATVAAWIEKGGRS